MNKLSQYLFKRETYNKVLYLKTFQMPSYNLILNLLFRNANKVKRSNNANNKNYAFLFIKFNKIISTKNT